MFKNKRTDFEKKLLMMVNKEFFGHIMEPSKCVEDRFGSCWFLVEVMLEKHRRYSKTCGWSCRMPILNSVFARVAKTATSN